MQPEHMSYYVLSICRLVRLYSSRHKVSSSLDVRELPRQEALDKHLYIHGHPNASIDEAGTRRFSCRRLAPRQMRRDLLALKHWST